ncbi:HAD family hydrolase [Euzebya tangerina]|uniref:HAD family hydrolase n=1 Tax=Euzebya tangerina TaxID=591198 RepID=UPI000E31757D|nr:HAD family hydrolase [Euzebya tangerina]
MDTPTHAPDAAPEDSAAIEDAAIEDAAIEDVAIEDASIEEEVPNSAAFFDLDRTLMSGSSAYYFGKAAYREGLLPMKRLVADGTSALAFRLFGASDEQSEAVRDRILATVAGVEAQRLTSLAPQVIEELLPRIKPEADALLDMHREAGRDVYIISATPIEIVGELADALQITGGLGTKSEIVDGKYTGQLAAPFCYGEGKADVIRLLAQDRGYDLTRCYSYSDSASDLPMMQIVGHPVAVNPDRSLMSIAHRRGWPVVEFNRTRKLVVRGTAVATLAVATAGIGMVAGIRIGERNVQRTLSKAFSLRLPRP